MVQPINYILDVKTPFQAATEGFNLGAAGEAARVQREDRERAIAQQAAAQQQLAELNAERARVFANPTIQGFESLASRLPKDQADAMLTISQRMSDREQEAQATIGTNVFSAVYNGSPQTAIDILRKESEAAKNAGKNDLAQGWDTWIKLIEVNPQNAAGTVGTLLAATPKGKERLTSAIAAMKAPSEIRTSEAGATEKEVTARAAPQVVAGQIAQTAHKFAT